MQTVPKCAICAFCNWRIRKGLRGNSQLPKLDVEGSSPFARFDLRQPWQETWQGIQPRGAAATGLGASQQTFRSAGWVQPESLDRRVFFMARPRKPWYRSDRDWWMVEFDGRQVKLCRGRENRADAEQKFHALMAERLANPPVDGGNPTVASVIDAYLDFAMRRDAPSTFYERKLYCQAFVDAHGWRLVRDCIPYHLSGWVDEHASWRSDWTRSYAIRTIKRPFNWAVQQGLIPKSPFAGVPHRPGRRRRPMTPEEYKTLLKAAGLTSRLGEILHFLFLTGCRPGEVRSLRWADVDLDRAIIVLLNHKTAKTQREYQPRIIPLVPAVIKLLRRIRQRQENDNFVFVNRRGRPWARCSMQQLLRRARRQVGLPEDVLLYGLRHHFGTTSVKNGNDLVTTAALMGHRSTRMTEYYVHLAGEREHLAAAMVRATTSVLGASRTARRPAARAAGG